MTAAAPSPVKAERRDDAPAGGFPMRPARRASLRISRSVAIAAALLIVMLGGTTAALVLERVEMEARVIYVVGLPMIEVEATYLPATKNEL